MKKHQEGFTDNDALRKNMLAIVTCKDEKKCAFYRTVKDCLQCGMFIEYVGS